MYLFLPDICAALRVRLHAPPEVLGEDLPDGLEPGGNGPVHHEALLLGLIAGKDGQEGEGGGGHVDTAFLYAGQNPAT